MRILLLLLVSVVPSFANIGFQCVPSPRDFSGILFEDKKMSKVIRHWTCTFTNLGEGPVLLTEGDAIAAMISQDVSAYPTDYVRVLFEKRIKKGFWKTMGRIVSLVLKGAIIFAGAEFIEMGEDLRLGIVLGAQMLSSTPELLSNRAPTMADFERMAWEDQRGFETSVVLSMFAGPTDNDKPIRGLLQRVVILPPTVPPDADPIVFEKVSWPQIDKIALAIT